MKTKQEIQMELLQDIDEICSKNNLNYILVEQKALYAYLNGTLEDDYRMVAVAMTQGDIDRFCQICENENREDRYIEGLFNNPYYLQVHVSYGDRKTTDFDTIYRNRNYHKGIRIRIYPIVKVEGKDGTVYDAMTPRLRKERTLRKILCKKIESDNLWYMRAGLDILNGAYSLTGGGTRYYNEIKKRIFIDRWEDIQQFSKVRINTKIFTTDLFRETQKIEIDGVGISFPKDAEEYFIQSYGKKFREKSITPRTLKNRVVIDTEIGYEDVIDNTDDILKEIRTIHEDIVLKRKKVKEETESTRNVWRLVRMTEKQIEFQQYFTDDKIDELSKLDLNNEDDFEMVSDEFYDVIRVLRRYSKFGMTFSINPKTDALIKKVLLILEEEDLLNRLDEISKKEYFVE